ncbi:MAG: hypothetical protein ACXVCY_05870 [Pseudobdellovibrionaceae bacterium]
MKKNNLTLASVIFTLGYSLASNAITKGPSCSLLFIDQRPEVKAFVSEDGLKQWLSWEQNANFARFRKSAEPIDISTVPVEKSSVNIEVGNDVPVEIANLVNGGSNILWWRHPYNKSSKVPHINEPSGPVHIAGYMTSSRSLLIDNGKYAVTVKLPVDYPHGPKGEYQGGKDDNKDDIDSALRRSNHIDKVDKAFGPDDRLLILRELMTVADVKTGNGFLFRDVTLLQDGHYYLPALSIPYVGREIAKLNNMPFEEFWQKYYGELLGQSKALLLARYGLQMETPNSQNMLIQFDRNLKPTGRLVFRDVSDSYLVEEVAAGLGYEDALASDKQVDWGFHNRLKPFWENSSWRMDEAGDLSVPWLTLKKWGLEHDKTYFETLQSELNVQIPLVDSDYVNSADQYLKTAQGRAALKAYRLKKEAQMHKMDHAG